MSTDPVKIETSFWETPLRQKLQKYVNEFVSDLSRKMS